MAIRWKVVTLGRKSCSCADWAKEKVLGSAVRTYTKGKVVTAHPATMGLFVFERKWQAVRFMNAGGVHTGCKIIKVKGIGRGKRPGYLLPIWYPWFRTKLLTYLRRKEQSQCDREYIILEGTLCYRSVEVLE